MRIIITTAEQPIRLLRKTNSAELSEVRFGSGSYTTAGTRPSFSGHTRDSVIRRGGVLTKKFQLQRSSLEMRAVGRRRYTIHLPLQARPVTTPVSHTRE